MSSPAQRSKRQFVGVIVTAALLSSALIAASLVDATWGAAPRPSFATSAAPAGLFAGIPQHGLVLGSATAPVTLVEYADLQCPYCAAWARQTLPVLVADYVRRGRLRVVFHGLAFLGPDSRSALTATVAAGRQNRLWDVLDGLYRRQGPENSGWFTEALLGQVTAGIPGLDRARLEGDRGSAWTDGQMRAAAAAATTAGVSGTPSFQIGATGGQFVLTTVTSLGPEGIRPAIDALLAE
jgi:protein-disulfide isomerase